MNWKTQPDTLGVFIVSEGNGQISREVGVLASGNNLAAGTVLGKLTSGGNYVPLLPGAATGAEDASAILLDNVDATAGNTAAVVIVRDAEVADVDLIFPTGITAPNKATAIAELAALNIIVR